MQALTEIAGFTPAATGSLIDHLKDNVAIAPRAVALARKRFGHWESITFADFHDEVRTIAKGIAAAGVQPGDRVAILSSTRYEWTLADYAIWYCGAVSVPVSVTATAEEVEWILSDTGAVGVFLEDPGCRETFDAVADSLPNVKYRWQIDQGALDLLADQGEMVGDDDLDSRCATVRPDSVATIIATAGAAGAVRGCTLTHRNLTFAVDAVLTALPELFVPGSSTLLFLPLSHVFGRLIQLCCIRGQVRLGHSSDLQHLLAEFASFQPTVVVSIPAVFAKIFHSAQQQAHARGTGRIFDLAAAHAIEYGRSLETGGPNQALKLQHALFERLVYSGLRAALGGRVKHAVCGGSALESRLGHFFGGIGITVLEGYGLTETSGAVAITSPQLVRIGSVGQPLPGTSVAIASDGEILLKGPQIFTGYWNDEGATREVLDAEGWFHSGDLGGLDDHGLLTITARRRWC